MKFLALISVIVALVAAQSSTTASSSSLSQCAQMCMGAALSMGSNCAGIFTDCLAGQGCPDDPSKLQAAISSGCAASPPASASSNAVVTRPIGTSAVGGNTNLNSNVNSGSMSGNMLSSMNTDPNIPFGLPGSNLGSNMNNQPNNMPTDNTNFNSNSNSNFNSNSNSNVDNFNTNANSNPSSPPAATNPFNPPQTTGQVPLSPFLGSSTTATRNATLPSVGASLAPVNGTWPTITGNATAVYSSSVRIGVFSAALVMSIPLLFF